MARVNLGLEVVSPTFCLLNLTDSREYQGPNVGPQNRLSDGDRLLAEQYVTPRYMHLSPEH